jgi:hypothetical protein
MRRFRLLTVAASLLAMLTVALPVSAAEPVSVDVLGCALFFGGKQDVPADTDINLISRWSSKTRVQGLKFLERVRPVAKINGVKIPHPNQYWTVPVKFDDDLWVTTWTYPAGQLSNGESFVAKFQLLLRERVWDGSRWYKAGKVFDSALECKVKGVIPA